jgi:hypothetical protein
MQLARDICSKPLHFLQASIIAKLNWSSFHCRNSDSQIRQACEPTMLNYLSKSSVVIAPSSSQHELTKEHCKYMRYAICCVAITWNFNDRLATFVLFARSHA